MTTERSARSISVSRSSRSRAGSTEPSGCGTASDSKPRTTTARPSIWRSSGRLRLCAPPFTTPGMSTNVTVAGVCFLGLNIAVRRSSRGSGTWAIPRCASRFSGAAPSCGPSGVRRSSSCRRARGRGCRIPWADSPPPPGCGRSGRRARFRVPRGPSAPQGRAPRSSSGLGHRPLKAEITGSNPVRGTSSPSSPVSRSSSLRIERAADLGRKGRARSVHAGELGREGRLPA